MSGSESAALYNCNLDNGGSARTAWIATELPFMENDFWYEDMAVARPLSAGEPINLVALQNNGSSKVDDKWFGP